MQAVTDSNLQTLADRHYAAGDATRKAPSYFMEYERLLAHRRQQPMRVLELGVSSGASLLVWRDYLPNAVIVGVDIAEPPACIVDQPRIHFVRGSQDDVATLDRAGEIAGGRFDLIIDDASHIGYLTKRSFQHLFPRWLQPGGTYVIEDFGTGFLPDYPDGAAYQAPPEDAAPDTRQFTSHQFGMVGLVKQFIDHMMTELMTSQPARYDIARLTVLTNIALLEKASTAAARGVAPSKADCPQSVTMLAEELRRQGERLAALEAGLRQVLRPGGSASGSDG